MTDVSTGTRSSVRDVSEPGVSAEGAKGLAPLETIWGLVDDRTGHTGQVLGVIAKLGVPYALKRLEYRPLAGLPTALLGATMQHLSADSRTRLAPPFPPLVIAAGRRTIPVLRAIKKRSPSTRTIYLMWPESTKNIDLIVVPEHDGKPSQPNVITTLAPLHAVTAEALVTARDVWAPQFAHLPRPYVGLCLGGATKKGSYSAAEWREIIMRALGLAGSGSLLITTSRRTPKEALDLCKVAISKPHLLYAWDVGKDNPYLGILGAADGIIVTGDSLSMCAEACVSGAPVFIYASADVAPEKHRALHETLYQRGLARPLNAMARLDWKPQGTLGDVATVAEEIRKRFPEAF